GTTLIIACGKNNNGPMFEPFAIVLDPETMIYDVDPCFDIERWQKNLTRKRDEFDLQIVGEVCETEMKKADLVNALLEETGCSKATAYRKINEAVRSKIVKRDAKTKLFSPVAFSLADFS